MLNLLGADEALWSRQAAQDKEQAAMDAIAAGMIVFAASLRNRRAPNHPHANLPPVMQWGPISCHRRRPTLAVTALDVH